jgi:tetratricopeptide (TPR) repeat protein
MKRFLICTSLLLLTAWPVELTQAAPLFGWEKYQDRGETELYRKNYPLALKYFLKAEYELTSRGLECEQLGDTFNALGVVFTEQGEYESAERSFRRAISLQKHYRGPYATELMTARLNLSALLKKLGRNPEADDLAAEALEIKKYLAEHGDVPVSLEGTTSEATQNAVLTGPPSSQNPLLEIPKLAVFNTFADITIDNSLPRLVKQALDALSQGKYEQSDHLLQRAMNQNLLIYGYDHPNTAKLLNNLAVVYQRQRNYARAEEFYRDAIAIQSKFASLSNADFSRIYDNFRSLYLSQGKFNEADLLTRQIYPTQAPILPPSDPASDEAKSKNDEGKTPEPTSTQNRVGSVSAKKPPAQRK